MICRREFGPVSISIVDTGQVCSLFSVWILLAAIFKDQKGGFVDASGGFGCCCY
jgi:hypothetical protein